MSGHSADYMINEIKKSKQKQKYVEEINAIFLCFIILKLNVLTLPDLVYEFSELQNIIFSTLYLSNFTHYIQLALDLETSTAVRQVLKNMFGVKKMTFYPTHVCPPE